MIEVSVYKLEQKMGTVTCDSQSDRLTIKGDRDFVEFIESLNDDDYASNREFARDLPERLGSYIHAQLDRDD